MSNKGSKPKKSPEDDSKKQDATDHYNDLVATFMTGVILPMANQISLLSLCTVVNETTDGPCADILAQTDALLPVLANAAFDIPSSCSGRITVVPSAWGQSTVGPVTYVLYVGCKVHARPHRRPARREGVGTEAVQAEAAKDREEAAEETQKAGRGRGRGGVACALGLGMDGEGTGTGKGPGRAGGAGTGERQGKRRKRWRCCGGRRDRIRSQDGGVNI
ncbi:hypothetical protein QBC46DRAFT_355532 [Diplogelasinospora grovesii]|uniref:Uncharacterized protein n=1 Tax=Diplogelasinospora grovesii TaxID=303347 RepID=A0AAN6N4E7_9PEZI|nr:hypothetical protein QBC46DRAFT_355532 [Diplogelasinospora grovesii]